MDQTYSRRRDEPEFNLREWALMAKKITRENTNSRRFSASNITSLREDTKFFRSTITTISSTVSSPGYQFKDEIDPSTYSFTTALKALQARSLGRGGGGLELECLCPDGFVLNSKWNEAEKYISNPLSGEVPIQCLSAQTLCGRSFRKLNGRVVSSNHLTKIRTERYYGATTFHEEEEHDDEVPFPSIQEEMGSMTRDVGTQSTPADVGSSGSTSPAPTLSIQERSLNRYEADGGSSPHSNAKLLNYDKQVEYSGEKEETKRKMEKKAAEEKCRCRQFKGGCLSLWMRKG